MPTSPIDDFSLSLSQFGIEAALRCLCALVDFIDCGDLYRHHHCGRRRYADRRRVPLEQIVAKLSHWIEFEDRQAGIRIPLCFSAGIEDTRVAPLAGERGKLVAPPPAYSGGKRKSSGLPPGFCACTGTEILSHVAPLAQIIWLAANPE